MASNVFSMEMQLPSGRRRGSLEFPGERGTELVLPGKEPQVSPFCRGAGGGTAGYFHTGPPGFTSPNHAPNSSFQLSAEPSAGFISPLPS